MAHDRMTDDNAERNMGRAGKADDMDNQDFGQRSPGRHQQNDPQTGQKGAGQKNNPLEDDDFSPGGNRPNQTRQSDAERDQDR
ncbi:MAG TPA: hypothetical protein VFZ22_07130 [Pyrinomonadaceae bacterium]|nr:hypothetical protein [Pyrinomonadaceae bacterium]